MKSKGYFLVDALIIVIIISTMVYYALENIKIYHRYQEYKQELINEIKGVDNISWKDYQIEIKQKDSS